MTGLLDRLEKQQLVRRQRCTIDCRIVHVELTQKANQLLAKKDQPILDAHRQLIDRLELKELSRLLEKARESLRESVPGDESSFGGVTYLVDL